MDFHIQTTQLTALEPIFGEFLRNFRRLLSLCNTFRLSLLLGIKRSRFRFPTFLKFRNRRLIFPTILKSAHVGKAGDEMWLIPHLRVFPQYSTSCQVSTSKLSMPAVRPFSFVYRMVEEYPRTPSIVPELLLLVLFYVGSFLERPYRKSLTEHGNGRVPINKVS